MKIETLEDGTLNFKKVFNGIQLESESGNKIFICMRDNGFEINYQGKNYEAKNDLISLYGYTLHKNEVDSNDRVPIINDDVPEHLGKEFMKLLGDAVYGKPKIEDLKDCFTFCQGGCGSLGRVCKDNFKNPDELFEFINKNSPKTKTVKNTKDRLVYGNYKEKESTSNVTYGNLVWDGEPLKSRVTWEDNIDGDYKVITGKDSKIYLRRWELLEEPKKEEDIDVWKRNLEKSINKRPLDFYKSDVDFNSFIKDSKKEEKIKNIDSQSILDIWFGKMTIEEFIQKRKIESDLEKKSPKKILSPKGESDLEALQMVFDTELSLNVSQRKAIDICLDKASSLEMNSISVSNINHWKSVKLSLEKLKEKYDKS